MIWPALKRRTPARTLPGAARTHPGPARPENISGPTRASGASQPAALATTAVDPAYLTALLVECDPTCPAQPPVRCRIRRPESRDLILRAGGRFRAGAAPRTLVGVPRPISTPLAPHLSVARFPPRGVSRALPSFGVCRFLPPPPLALW